MQQAIAERGATDAARLLHGAFALGAAWGVSVSITPLLYVRLGLAEDAIGALAGASAAGVLASGSLAARLARRHSARRIVVASMLAYAVLVGCFPLLGSTPLLLAARVVDGALATFVAVATEAFLLARADRERAWALGRLGMHSAAGLVVGAVVASVFVNDWPLERLFALAGLVAVVAALASARMLDSPPIAEAEGAPARPGALLSGLRRGAAALSTGLAYGAFHGTFVTLVPVFLVRERHLSREAVVALPAAFVLGFLASTRPASRFADRVGEAAALRWLATGAASCILAFAFASDTPSLVALGFLSGAVVAPIQPIGGALRARLAGARIAEAQASYAAALAIGRVAGPFVAALCLRASGGLALLAFLAAIFAALAVGLSFGLRR